MKYKFLTILLCLCYAKPLPAVSSEEAQEKISEAGGVIGKHDMNYSANNSRRQDW